MTLVPQCPDPACAGRKLPRPSLSKTPSIQRASQPLSAPFSVQGILLVYDITNRWSFDGIDRWIKEIDEVGMLRQAPPPGACAPMPQGSLCDPCSCPDCAVWCRGPCPLAGDAVQRGRNPPSCLC